MRRWTLVLGAERMGKLKLYSTTMNYFALSRSHRVLIFAFTENTLKVLEYPKRYADRQHHQPAIIECPFAIYAPAQKQTANVILIKNSVVPELKY